MDKFNRLTLINQFEILKALNPNEEKYYAEKIEILTEGYEYHYSEIFENISDPLPEEDSRFVLDILNMYRDITFSKNKLKDINSIDNYYIQFKGFDFNSSTEFKLALYAQFFIEKLNRFQEIVEDSDFNTFNSHKPMRGTYIKFLENYNDLKSTNNYQFGN
ncbi:TPA: YfbU family protein, partial [Enterococcus faecium]